MVRNGNSQLSVEDARSQGEPMQAELRHMQRPRGFKMQHDYKTRGRISKAARCENKPVTGKEQWIKTFKVKSAIRVCYQTLKQKDLWKEKALICHL